eukprot:356704-Chlamydomonas_euryale.AAC.9
MQLAPAGSRRKALTARHVVSALSGRYGMIGGGKGGGKGGGLGGICTSPVRDEHCAGLVSGSNITQP